MNTRMSVTVFEDIEDKHETPRNTVRKLTISVRYVAEITYTETKRL